ncbi:MAG: sulfite exporter TauE/SafE family protein [Candidatus Bipolaricaulota bacterium]
MDYLLLAVAATVIGVFASMIGVGGGIFMVPLLTVVFVPTTHVAVATSLAAIVFNSVSSTIGYGRQGIVDFRLGFMLMPSALGGGFLGAYLTEFVSSDVLAVAFGVLLIYVAVLMLWGRTPKELAERFKRTSEDGQVSYRALPVMGVGLLAGTASGFFGIGGGTVMVPAITLLLGTAVVVAAATSLFVMGPTALAGLIQHSLQGNPRFDLAVPLAIGIILGAQIGSHLAPRVSQPFLRRLFGVVMLYAAGNMIWKALGS